MHRFFVSPEILAQQSVTLVGDQAHQIRRVLRMRPGEYVTLLDNRGWAYEAILVAYDEADVNLRIVRSWAAVGEPRAHITLFQAVLKGDRFAWVLQKGTEIGVSRFVPVVCERNVVDDPGAIEQKRDRWERIIQEAAEQSGRARLPQLAQVQLFAAAVQPTRTPGTPGIPTPVRLVLWEGEPVGSLATLRNALAPWVGRNVITEMRIQVYIGPEGGFTTDEVRLAQRCGVQAVTLGPRVLRAESAGLVATAIVLYEAGEI